VKSCFLLSLNCVPTFCRCRRLLLLLITLSDTKTQTHTQSECSRQVIGSSRRHLPNNIQHTQLANIPATNRTVTPNPTNRVAADLYRRQHGHRSWHFVSRWVNTRGAEGSWSWCCLKLHLNFGFYKNWI
jgi:hypothetical protein